MRGLVFVCCAAAGCGFRGPAAADAVPDAVAPDDAGGGDVSLDCAVPKLSWYADFSVDPTTYDHNGDGVPDFHFRGGPAGTFDGAWTEPGTPALALDTNPKEDFATHTKTHVRMRNTVRGGNHGAVFWINSGYNPATYAGEFIDVRLDVDGLHQTLTLYWWNNVAEVSLFTIPNLTTGFVDADLDIDPIHDTLVLHAGGMIVPMALMRAPNTNDGRWATVIAYTSDAVFDEVRIDSCP